VREATARDGNTFGFGLLNTLAREKPYENLLLSPLSLRLALSFAAAGARGETDNEMAAVLRLDTGDIAGAVSALGGLQRALVSCTAGSKGSACDDDDDDDDAPSTSVVIANRLWLAQGLQLQEEFAEMCARDFGAPVGLVDFVEDSAGAIEDINGWASDNTRGMVPELLNSGDVDCDTAMVITNAVCFAGKWSSPFDAGESFSGSFIIDGGRRSQRTRMMMQTKEFVYSGRAPCQAQYLEMPYKGGELAMAIVLPPSGDDGPARLRDALDELTKGGFGAFRQGAKAQEVEVILPKFSVDAGFEASKTLKAMGLEKAFADADFSGIAEEIKSISTVIHKARIEVDETGSVAAAATAVGTKGGDRRKTEFTANRPFTYAIFHRRTSAVLFAGILENPGGEEEEDGRRER
jgi:serpin B